MKPGVNKLEAEKKEDTKDQPIDFFSCESKPAVWGFFDALSPNDQRLCVFFLQQNVGCSPGVDNLPEFLSCLEKRIDGGREAGKRIAAILTRFVNAREGISRQEISFLRKLWYEFQYEGEQKVGAPT